jgi:hypothetical protein
MTVDGATAIDSAPAPDTASTGDAASAPDATPDDAGACSGCWRSALYPADWTPASTDGEGRFLHDFSYAGYRGGEPLPAVAGPVVDVTDHGADPGGGSDATAAFQAAIAAVQALSGGVVHVPAGLYRIDGTLEITASHVVLRGDGASASRVHFTLAAGMSNRAHLRLRGSIQQGPDLLLAVDGATRGATVQLADASSLAPGDDVSLGWVITPAFVDEHGMTGTWTAFNDTWRPFFRRQVVAVDTSASPHRVTLDVPLRYPARVRDSASLRRESGYLREVGVEHLGVSNAVAWDDAWASNRVHAIDLDGVADGWLRAVRSFAAPGVSGGYHLQSGGFYVLASKRVTVAGCRLEKAQNRGSGGNGYLYEVSKSSEVLVVDSAGLDGRHNFIQNWDFGTTGCVFLRCASSGSRNLGGSWDPIGLPAYCEYHHSLATANLVDSCTLDDGWYGGNRGSESTGAGHTATHNVYWNNDGSGRIRSYAYGWGYIIGHGGLTVETSLPALSGAGTSPADWVETATAGTALEPASLYEDQRRRRLPP